MSSILPKFHRFYVFYINFEVDNDHQKYFFIWSIKKNVYEIDDFFVIKFNKRFRNFPT